MGKKDAAASRGAPVDQYRRKIGKHDSKKGAPMTKEMKKRSEARKSAMSMQDVMLLVGTLLVLVLCIYFYFFFFVYLAQDSTTDDTSPPTDAPK